ncbi:MAG: hypothetical protein JXR84_14680, partial [Anaerolineae bacterium]|nr:hypothetical protein [Anaerolineae bacterium]
MLDLYAYRNELKSNLLYRWQCLDLESQALDWAWIQYAFVMSHAVDTQLIANSFQQSLRWVELDSTWSAEGNWGAIGLLCHSLHQEEYSNWEAIAERLTQGALLLSRKSL